MEYTSIGESGIKISRIGLGCLSFGEHRPWSLPEDESKAIIDRAIDLGINFFDTANAYASGGK